MVIGVGISALARVVVDLCASWRYSFACLHSGAKSITVLRRSSACWTMLSRGTKWISFEFEPLGERLGEFQLLVGLALVANQPAKPHAAGVGVFQNALGDIVGRVKGHHLAGHDDVDFLRLVLADRHGEAAANNVAEHVVGDVVDVVVGAVLLEEVDGGDDAAAGAADAGLGTAGLPCI